MIRVRALGASEIQIGRRRITLATEMVFALALYLCLRAGERLTRDEIVETFWGTRDLVKGRHSLRQALYRLRRSGLALDDEGEELYLDPGRVDCDASVALREGWPDTAPEETIEALGEFAPGLTRPRTTAFHEWLDGVRGRLAAQYRDAALHQIVRARREGRWSDLERWARVVLRTDPLNEEATFARAESAAMAGSKAMALEILDQYMEELGDRAAVIGLPATVLRRRIAERRAEDRSRHRRRAALVGRETIMARLTSMVDTASQGAGGALVLWGAPGVGKTRIANEVRAYAELAGFRSVVVRATGSTLGHPLSLLLALAPLARDLPGAAGSSPAAMAIIQRLLTPTGDATPFDAVSTGAVTLDTLAWSFAEVLTAASVEVRTLILVDDLHNADDASVAVLRSVVRATGACRILWLGTSRASLLTASSAGSSDAPAFTPIPVGPLSVGAATLLAESLSIAAGVMLSEAMSSRIARVAGGNPLFIRELTAPNASPAGEQALPPSLVQLLSDRLHRLPAHQLRLLRCVSLLGPLASISRIHALLRAESSSTTDAITYLESEGILFYGESRCLELHECWLHALFEAFPRAVRASLSLECAEQLSLASDTSNTLERTWRAAELFAASGDSARAIGMFSTAADQLVQRGLAAEASTALSHAIALAHTDADRLPLLASLASAQHSAEQLDATIQTCEVALPLLVSTSAQSASTRTMILSVMVDALWKTNRDHRAPLTDLAHAVLDDRITDSIRHYACLMGMRAVLNDAVSPLERHFFDVARSATARSGPSTIGELVSLVYYTERGTTEEVLAAEESLAIVSLMPSTPRVLTLSLRYRSNALRWIGQRERSLALAEKALKLAVVSGLPDEAAATALQLAFLYLDEDEVTPAEEWLRRCEAWSRLRTTPERMRALVHVRGRILLQKGSFEECLAFYRGHLPEIESDTMEKRRTVEAASVARAAAAVGDAALANRMLRLAVATVENDPPTRLLDYPAEIVARTYIALGRAADGTRVAADYLRRRQELHQRPLAPFYRELERASRPSLAADR